MPPSRTPSRYRPRTAAAAARRRVSAASLPRPDSWGWEATRAGRAGERGWTLLVLRAGTWRDGRGPRGMQPVWLLTARFTVRIRAPEPYQYSDLTTIEHQMMSPWLSIAHNVPWDLPHSCADHQLGSPDSPRSAAVRCSLLTDNRQHQMGMPALIRSRPAGRMSRPSPPPLACRKRRQPRSVRPDS